MKVDYDVRDIGLADQGLDKIGWAEKNVKIDKLTGGQKNCLASWEMGI